MDVSENGSKSALSIIAGVAEYNPAATAIVVGSFSAIIAAEFIYNKYEAYEEKKHKEHVDSVNKLHRKYLACINVESVNEKLSLPPIFNINEETSEITSMHFTHEQIEAMHSSSSRIEDPALLGYRENIANAIRKLKEYYFKRNDENDVTAGVLCWLIYILDAHGQNFKGYAIDIAFLKNIEKFISEYASLDNSETSQRFSWMSAADEFILRAITLLEKHRKSMALQGIITELGSICLTHSNELLRSFVRLTIKNKYENYIDYVTPQELEQGFIHHKRINKTALGYAYWHERERRLKSFFENWTRTLASYYLKTLDLPNSPDIPDTEPPETLFTKPKDDKLVDYAFNRTANFLTRKSQNGKLVEITDPYDRADRIKVLKNLASLIHQLISMHYLCTQLIKCFQQLGNIYMEHPRHMEQIFLVMDALSKKISDDANTIHYETHWFFDKLSIAKRKNSFRVIPESLMDCTDFLEKKIKDLNARIQNAHKARAISTGNPWSQKHLIKNHMLEVAIMLERIYTLPDLPKPPPLSMPSNSELGASNSNLMAPASIRPLTIEEIKEDSDDESVYENPENSIEKTIVYFNDINPDCTDKITDLINKIHVQVGELHKQSFPPETLNAWLTLYSTLVDMQKQALLLSVRNNGREAANGRSRALLLTTLSFCLKAKEILSAEANDREKKAHEAAKQVRITLSSPECLTLINAHQNRFSKVIYAIFPFSFFRTHSMKKVSAACDAFDAIARLKN